jgi:hypothetical protein
VKGAAQRARVPSYGPSVRTQLIRGQVKHFLEGGLPQQGAAFKVTKAYLLACDVDCELNLTRSGLAMRVDPSGARVVQLPGSATVWDRRDPKRDGRMHFVNHL